MDKQIAFAAKSKNTEIQSKSQSGGIFSIISDYILENGGVIYGCKMKDDYTVVHSKAVSKAERDEMRLSKYVQSNLGETFTNIKKDLSNNNKVLFVGTPCQVAGLKSYLFGIDITNLTLIDIVCHGTPSPGVWNDFIEYLRKKHKNISNVVFRNKKYGWESSVCTFDVNGKEQKNNSYSTLFYRHYIVRPSCFKCMYKNLNRQGDITIGDCWGIEKNDKSFYDKDGVSLVIVNTEHGLDIMNRIKEKIEYKQIDINNYLQPALSKNYEKPKKREKFWDDYKKLSFEDISKKYGGNGLLKKIKRAIKKVLKSK